MTGKIEWIKQMVEESLKVHEESHFMIPFTKLKLFK